MGARSRFAWMAVVAVACGSPPPPSPSAVITSQPTALCVGDTTTPIHLDAKKSAPRLSLVAAAPDPNEPPLSFAWTFEGAAYTVTDGDVATDTVVVTLTAADRPLHVHVTVKNGSGGVAGASTTIAITTACAAP